MTLISIVASIWIKKSGDAAHEQITGSLGLREVDATSLKVGLCVDDEPSLHREPHFALGQLALGVRDLDHKLVATARQIGRGNLYTVTEDLAFFSHALGDVEFKGTVHNFQGFPIDLGSTRRQASQVDTDRGFDRARQ